jgi:hypothetical protein
MRTIVSTLCAASALIACAAPAIAQEGPDRRALTGIASSLLYVPAAANVQGQFGAYFKTKTALLNPTFGTAFVTATLYTPSGRGGTATFTVSPGQVRVFENTLSDLFGYTGGGAVRFDAGSTKLIGQNEVFVDGANGRYSTVTPVYIILDFVGSTYKDATVGVNVNATFRTNIACMNDNSSSAIGTADVYDSSGAHIAPTVTISLPAFSWVQVPFTVPVTNGAIVWGATQPFVFCYASVVHNVSNDGTFLDRTTYVP